MGLVSTRWSRTGRCGGNREIFWTAQRFSHETSVLIQPSNHTRAQRNKVGWAKFTCGVCTSYGGFAITRRSLKHMSFTTVADLPHTFPVTSTTTYTEPSLYGNDHGLIDIVSSAPLHGSITLCDRLRNVLTNKDSAENNVACYSLK